MRSLLPLAAAVLVGALAACQGTPSVVGDWALEGSTNYNICLLSIFEDKAQWAHNCNGNNTRRGTWKLEASTLRLTHEDGRTENCEVQRDGSKLTLTGRCYVAGQYNKWP